MGEEPMNAKREHVVFRREAEPGLGALRIDVEQAMDLVWVSRRKHPTDETAVAVTDDDEWSLFTRCRKRLMKALGNHAELNGACVAKSVSGAVPRTNSGDLVGGLQGHDPAAGVGAHLVNFCTVVRRQGLRKGVIWVTDACGGQVGDGARHTRGRFVQNSRIVRVVLPRSLVIRRELVASTAKVRKVGFPQRRTGISLGSLFGRISANEVHVECPGVSPGLDRNELGFGPQEGRRVVVRRQAEVAEQQL